MTDKTDWFYRKTGKKLKDLRQERATGEQITRQKATRTQTEYDLRIISPDVFFTEEQRPNIHVIGSSRQGKSRFLEWLMREDIDRRIGCCLLDPTAGGETAYRMLAYCAEKKRDKVLFIDTEHTYSPYKKTLGLQPFKYDKDGRGWPKLKRISVDTLMEAIRSLYNVKDPAEQSRIERYLPAVFATLYDAKSPITDARYFSNKLYRKQQEELLLFADPDFQMDLREAFISHIAYANIQSTVNRLVRFFRGTLGDMFSAGQGVNWMKVVREHWAVIVRLDNLDFFDARLLGTYIISELETAKRRLNEAIDSRQDVDKRGRYPPYYLYADEAYMFASQSLKNMLDLKQKMNFKVTLAHHTAAQFKKDPEVYDSIKTNCDMTVEFYVKSRKDRDEIAGEMYGGDIDPKDASYANSNLPRQTAVIKIGRDAPVRTRIADVPTPKVSKEQLRDYLLELYRNDWYYDTKELSQKNDIPTRENIQSPPPRKAPNRKATGEATVPAGIRKRGEKPSVPAGDEKTKKAGSKRPIKI
jgi:hypothetical protein